MNAQPAIFENRTPLDPVETPWPLVRGQRPTFRLSDLWKAPFHDFPIRDEILYQFLPLSPDLDILEIGPGSGFTAFRLSREARQVSLLDVSAGAIEQLRSRLRDIRNLNFIHADLCAPGLKELIKKQFDAAFGLAVLDLLPDPAAGLRNLTELLSPGGRLVLEFPNYPPPKARGVTFFRERKELDRLLESAGFRAWTLHALRLRSHARFLFEFFHERPLRLLRRLRRTDRSGAKPLAYEETWAFQKSRTLEPSKALLHAGWAGLLGALHAGGSAFEALPLGDDILNHDLLLLARR